VTEIHANARGGLRVIGEAGQRTGVQRYTSNGVLDGFFGDHGVRWLTRRDEGVQDGAGRTLQVVTVVVPATDYDEQTTRLDVARFLPSGKRDMRFGHGGYVELPHSKGAASAVLARQRDGRVLVTFSTESHALPVKPPRHFLERLTPAGKLDRHFGKRGVVEVPPKDAVSNPTIFFAPDGDLLLVGGDGRVTGFVEGEHQLVIAAYTHAGRPDHNFGDNGIARSRIATTGRDFRVSISSIALDALEDMIVVGQRVFRTVDTPAYGGGIVARYTLHGRDCSFGAGGLVVDDGIGAANAVAIQPNGRIVVVGSGPGKRFAAARYMGGGRPRTCPGEG
jgi:uncharacterized delta-60 repeat protein